MLEREQLINQGYKPSKLENHFIAYCFISVVSILIPVFGSLYWIYKSIKNLIKKQTKFYRHIFKTTYVRDRRFKTGARPNGKVKVKEFAPNSVKCNNKERKQYIVKGIFAMTIAIIITTLHVFIIIGIPSSNNNQSEQNKSASEISSNNLSSEKLSN